LELERAIGNEPHQFNILNIDEIPKCLLRHISTANYNLPEPYSKTKLREYTRNIARFLHDITDNRGWLEMSCCQTLIEFIKFLPEPEYMLEYKRISNLN